jgi:hypothetical protein
MPPRKYDTLRASRWARRTTVASVFAMVALLARPASAMDSYAAEYSWKPFMPLFGSGTALFLAGYVPAFGAAAPTTFRAVATAFYNVPTVGLLCAAPGSPDYTCSGYFGAEQLLIPLAGPFLYASNHPRDSAINPNGLPVSETTQTLLYVDGAVQITGAVLMGIGLATGHYEHDARSSFASGFSLSPMLGGGRGGLTLTYTGL